jgi:glycosyltransferase involved in cell wall biosynthesis
LPFVVSAHGGDLYSAARQSASGEIAVRRAFASARLVLANSTAIEEQCKELGATATRVVHLGTDVPRQPVRGDRPAEDRRIVTVANLVARKRHEDVLRAISLLRDVEPQLRWLVVGDGPERHRLEDLARRLELADRVEFRGALPHQAAVDAARSADVFVLPSVQEAFGVAYVEAMAGGVPVVGCRGEPGPEEIARCGGGVVLVPPHEPRALAAELGRLFADPHLRDHLGGLAHRNALDHFTWEACGRETYTAYTDALSSQ